MGKVDLPNIINIGMVSASESYIYYNMSDLALLLKNSAGSGFLYNSVPLKNIQYGAVKKPVISFPIQWLERENFRNTTIINDENIDNWIRNIQTIRKEYIWTDIDNKEWGSYNWDLICNEIFQEISSELKMLHV